MLASIVACAGSVLVASNTAGAQTSSASDEPIEVTAPIPTPTVAPPPVIYEPPPGPMIDEDEDDDEELVTVTPRTPPRDERAEFARRWRSHLGLGVTVGAGSPLGVIGGFVEANFHPAIGLMIGGGSGGTFGPAIGGTVHVRPFRIDGFAPYIALGFSTNFIPAQYHSDPSLVAPANAWWINLELGAEYRLPRNFALRLGVGWAILLNTGAFTNQQVGPQYGPLSNTELGWDPVSAADSHDEGHALGFPFAHLDALYHFGI